MQNMNNAKKLLALLLALAMVLALAACGNSGNTSNPTSTPAPSSDAPSEEGDSEPAEEPSTSENNTLVYGEDAMDGKFSPFFYTAVPDEDVVNMLHIYLLGSDREGGIVLNGIEGETRAYNGTDYTYTGVADCEIVENEDGTVDYNITMRDDIQFSDGTTADIDDVIFGAYVLCDPTYDGSSTVYALPIEGMDEYRAGMESLQNLILAAGPDGYAETEAYTQEQYDTFWAAFYAAGEAFAQEIVDYCVAAGANAEGDSVAACAINWGYELAEDATVADFFAAIVDAMGYDLSDDGINYESAGTSISDLIAAELGDSADEYAAGVAVSDSAPSITGIKRTGDYSMTITLTEVDATAIYQIAGLPIVPMHYYGDESLYDYDNNSFGFPKGDLSGVKAVTGSPIGAGPYTFVSFTNGTVSLQANPLYYKGEPKIEYINFMTLLDADKIPGLQTGTIDITSPSFTSEAVDEIAEINGAEGFEGDVITVDTVNYLGYGYIGMCAKNINVGGDPGSEASKDLRKAIATVIAVYRDVAMDSYYGELANVINYPISDTSWAAPRVTDEGYTVAFSKDVNGNDIYTDGMSEDEKYAAALEAALGFFEAAGYTVEDGKLTAAPEGASLEYEAIVPGGGTGDHPNFMILSMAKDALASIGFNLIVTDVSDGTVTIGQNLDAGTAEMWTMAWSATADPDMYQIYYSDIANGGANAGGSNKYYYIKDAELDELILAARQSFDQNYRKVLYKQCLDIIADWACEIPIYQRLNAVAFSTERVNMDTVTPDITTFWGWANDIELLELN